MGKPIAVTDADFASAVEQKQGLTVVDFWATWCGPCRMIAPILEQLVDEYAGKAHIAKLDVDANPHTAMHYGIMSIPTVAFFAPGQPPRAAVGFRPAEQLEVAFGLEGFVQPPAATDAASA